MRNVDDAIVVCGVAGRDIFKSKLGDKADHARIAGLHGPVCSLIHRPKFADEGFYNYQCGVEHGTDLAARQGDLRALIFLLTLKKIVPNLV